MNPIDERLSRLFRAVGSPDAEPIVEPFGLEARVLAAWRESASMPLWDTAILMRGLTLASLIMIVSLWPALKETNSFDSSSLQFADSSVQTDYP